MNDTSRTPPTLIVSIVIIVLAVGVAAYYMGRFGRAGAKHTAPAEELVSEPAAPAPAAVQHGMTSVDIPPTVTPPIPVVVEKGGRSSTVMVEKSTQVVVPVSAAPPPPTPLLGTMPVAPIAPVPPIAPTPVARRRIVVQVQPTPTPTPPESDLQPPPETIETPIPPPTPPGAPPQEAPEPEPEPTEPPRD